METITAPNRAGRKARIRQRMVWGLPIVSVSEVAIGLATAHFYPEVELTTWLSGWGLALFANLALWVVWFSGWIREPTVAYALLPVTPVAIALLCVGTGGFASSWAFALGALWLFWTAFAQLRTRTLALAIALELSCFVATLWAGGARPTRDVIPVAAMTLLVAILCVASSAARDKADRQLQQLLRTQEDLQARLEDEVRQRSRQIDELAAQLQNRVRERSLALARALDGIRARELAPGSVIDGRVEVVRLLGRGGMGTVYLGRDRVTAGPVAVKLIRPGLSDEAGIRRFLREAAVVSRVRDPRIVRTHHIDVTEDGQLYQVMDHVEGVALRRRLARSGYAVGPGARVCAGIAGAVAAAHGAGIVHRDIKPGNVMLTRAAPGVRVLDFGISKLTGDDAHGPVTETRHVIGTPGYMAPEQILRSAEVTPAADVYSLGIVLFEVVTGALPFAGRSSGAMLEAHLRELPPTLVDQRGVPAPLAALVARCLDKDPRARPEAREVERVLTQIADAAGAPSIEALNQADLGADGDLARVDPFDVTGQV
jgi:hypothetical protein